MKITRKMGENGYNYTLIRNNKSLLIESYNGYENTMIKLSLQTNNDNDLTFDITPLDKVYNAFDSLYINQKQVKELYDPFYGINMSKNANESYHLDFKNSGKTLNITNPNYGWITMFYDLQEIIPEEYDNYFIKLKKRKR